MTSAIEGGVGIGSEERVSSTFTGCIEDRFRVCPSMYWTGFGEAEVWEVFS